MKRRPCIAFIIPSLTTGGAERQLCNLAQHMDRDRFDVHVVVFYAPGDDANGTKWQEELRRSGVDLHILDKRPGPLGYLLALPRILGLMLRLRPDVIHGYSDANLLALLLGLLFRTRIAWGIRRSSRDLAKLDRVSVKVLRVLIRCSPWVDLVVFNSEAGRLNHERMGMRSPRMQVVPNGFDIDHFKPDAAQGAAQRQQWGIPDGLPLIGIVGRLDPAKDHPTFLRAAQRLGREWPAARFVCVGGGPEDYTRSLQGLATSLGIQDRTLWPGTCSHMPAVYNALSILILSSTDEGFPNVLGEAMACGTPCVATRVGDAAPLLGDTGLVTEIGDDEGLAASASRLLREPGEDRAVRARASRDRICRFFSIEALARNTEQALSALVSGAPGAGG